MWEWRLRFKDFQLSSSAVNEAMFDKHAELKLYLSASCLE